MTLCYYCLGKLPEWPTYYKDENIGVLVKICTACESKMKKGRENGNGQGHRRYR